MNKVSQKLGRYAKSASESARERESEREQCESEGVSEMEKDRERERERERERGGIDLYYLYLDFNDGKLFGRPQSREGEKERRFQTVTRPLGQAVESQH